MCILLPLPLLFLGSPKIVEVNKTAKLNQLSTFICEVACKQQHISRLDPYCKSHEHK